MVLSRKTASLSPQATRLRIPPRVALLGVATLLGASSVSAVQQPAQAPVQALKQITASSSADAQVLAPETELALARTELDNLTRQIAAAGQLSVHSGIGPETVSAAKSWHAAGQYFAHQEWLSTIRELNNYLTTSQVPDPALYLKAQYMLGRSYEELGYGAKSVRAYFRYLGAFLTASKRDHDELLEVLRHMIPLTAKIDDTATLDELLASLTSLDLPKDIEPGLFYYAAKAAAFSGNQNLAASWLNKAASGATDKGLKARALYMKSLIALTRRDYDAADQDLADVILANPDGETRDLARLALARIAVHRKKKKMALKYYALIPTTSPSFKDATLESVYVHLDLSQDTDARAKALLYLARWPDGADALQLRMLLAYLDMRAGDLTAAVQGIKAADAKLQDISDWMSHKLVGHSRVSEATLADFLLLTGSQLTPLPSVRQATALFARLAEAQRRLADLHGEIRDTVYTLGRMDLATIHPAWVNRTEQLVNLGDAVLQVGHRLAAAERNLYKDRLDAVDRQKLAASEARRTRLVGASASLLRRHSNWTSYAGYLDLTAMVADTSGKLRQAEAELAASRYLIQSAKSAKAATTRAKRLANLESQATKLTQSVQHSLELVRKGRVQDFINHSPHHTARHFIVQYAGLLQNEADTLSKAREAATGTAERLNAQDAARAWQRWRFLAGEIFSQFDALDGEMRTGLQATLDALDQDETKQHELSARLTDLTHEIEARLGVSLADILEQYRGAIDQRFAQHRKWQADIEWLTYQGKLHEERGLTDKYELEQQILKDNLTDLQEGVLWQWPK